MMRLIIILSILGLISTLWLQAETRPAGILISTGQMPLGSVVSPDGKYLVVVNSGSKSISVVEIAAAREVSHLGVPDAWMGIAMTKAGDKVYVSGGARAAVFEFSFANGTLMAGRTFPIAAAKDRTPQDFAGDVRLAPDGHLLYVTDLFRDAVVVMNPQSGLILSRIRTGRRPYRILFHPSGKAIYVSSWADGSIGEFDVNSGARLANFRVAPHPTDMLWVDGGLPAGANSGDDAQPEIKARVFVTASNTNSLYVFGASETGDLAKIGTINLALTPMQPMGTTPSALGLSSNQKTVYVACSDLNAVAAIDISGERNLVKGFVPAGSYPTAVNGLAEGRIAILNGRGGSVQIVDGPDEAKLQSYSDEVMAGFAYRDEIPGAPVTLAGMSIHAGGPIRHVIYVVRGADDGLTSGIAGDYAVRLGAAHADDPDPANVPPAGYLWNSASQAGLKIRNYGFAVHNLETPGAEGEQVDRVYDPALIDSTDMEYRGPDPSYPDLERAHEFAGELKEYEQVGDMPQLLLVRIGSGEQARDVIEEAVGASKFRNETVLIEVEADGASRVLAPGANTITAGNGNRFSALRTVELILGLRPMTVFDAAAPLLPVQ